MPGKRPHAGDNNFCSAANFPPVGRESDPLVAGAGVDFHPRVGRRYDAPKIPPVSDAAPNVSPELVKLLTEALRAAAVQPEGLDADAAATFCGISRSAFYTLDRKGMCPSPVQLGSGPRRWLRSELAAWMQRGCPPRRMWAQVREQVLRRAG